MSTDYLPRKESDLKVFALNFATLVVAAPATYGLTAGDATQIDEAVQEFATKYDLAVNPVSRTKAAIIAKDNAKTQLKAIVRGYAMMIKSNRAVSDESKANLRLTPYDLIRTAVPAPQTHPIITVVSFGVRQHELRVADETTPQNRLKPPGVVGLQLFCRIAEIPPATPMTSDFMTLLTRSAMTVNFQQADVGKTAYYFGRWQTAAGLVGPWGLMTSRMIAE